MPDYDLKQASEAMQTVQAASAGVEWKGTEAL